MPDNSEATTTDPTAPVPAPQKPPWRSIWAHFSGVAARNRAARSSLR
jgi:hypothetical protein